MGKLRLCMLLYLHAIDHTMFSLFVCTLSRRPCVQTPARQNNLKQFLLFVLCYFLSSTYYLTVVLYIHVVCCVRYVIVYTCVFMYVNCVCGERIQSLECACMWRSQETHNDSSPDPTHWSGTYQVD